MSKAKPWLIIRCTSGQEGKAERHLAQLGYPDAWHPTEKVRVSEAIYQRMLRASQKLPSWAQSRKPKRYKVKPIVTGYVFLPAPEVAIHEINDHEAPQLWMSVLCVNGAVYRLSDETMAQMRATPDRIKEMVDQAEAAKRYEWEIKRPVVGEEACVMEGPFRGTCGVVQSVMRGEVEIDIGALLGRVKCPEGIVERAV